MRSAYEPGGGGLDEVGAAFGAEEALLLDIDFAAFGAGFGRGFDAVDVVVGLVSTDLPGARFSGLDGRCSCSSALRFIPAAVTFLSGKALRDGMPGVLGLRTSDLAVEDETGGSGRRDVAGGIADGLPVSMDVSTESRN